MAEEAKTADITPQKEGAVVPQPDNKETPVVDKGRAETIEEWFGDHFRGTALGATTDLYNAAFAAKEDLKKRLAL